MKNPLRKITLIFLVIILLPIIILAIYELNALSQNEKMVKEIYQNQLDAILYSVNQYSDDIVQSWANDIDQVEVKDLAVYQEHHVKSLVKENWSINWIQISSKDGSVAKLFSNDSTTTADSIVDLSNLLEKNELIVEKLVRYQESGFRKIEPFPVENISDEIVLFFVLNKNLLPYKYGFISINPQLFISNTLSPKIQSISEDKFIISAYDMASDSMVFSTKEIESDLSTFDFRDANGATDPQKPDIQQRDFWLLPGYYLGISQEGTSLDQIAKNRTFTNLAMLVLMVVLIISGLIFLYRNIRKELQLSQAKAEFVSNVSHEIRTPLSLIQMFAETLEMNRVKTEDKKFEYYSIIKKESERLSRIVNRILSFSQVEAKKRRFEMSPVNIKELADEIFQSYDFHLKNKGFSYDYKCAYDHVPEIQGDREAISEAIINLIDNAIKYSEDDKKIEVEVGHANQQAFIKVKDFGIGIAKEHQKEVFDQFFRVPTNNVHNTKGSGLGLTLVKHIIDAHKGDITLDSVPGKGSTFTLFFPIKNQHHES